MIQITADIASLTKAQREAVSAFILTFPHKTDEDEHFAAIPTLPVYEDEESPETVFAPVSVPAAPTAGLDKAGLPWDERIHAGSKVFTADGMWRKRRGVDDALVAQVESELKALMAIPAAPLPAVPAPPAVAAAVPAPPPAPVVDGKTSFISLLSMASAAIGAGKLTQEQVSAAVVAAGVPSLPLLANRLDLVPQVASAIEVIIASAQ